MVDEITSYIKHFEAKVAERTMQISNQNQEIRKQKTMINHQYEELMLKTEAVEVQQKLVMEKNKNIMDSIRYAEKIQIAIMPSKAAFKKMLPQGFIYFQPRDIVSGDFYFLHENRNKIFFAIADCTGHGVPGGFMSMLGISLLNDIVKDKKILDPGDVLDLMSVKIISELKQTDKTGKSKDGMDITLCRLNKDKTELVFASANNDLWIIRDNVLIEYKSDRQPVGFHFGSITQFNQQKVSLHKGDQIFTFSDGYADQFGGKKGKKFKYKQLQQLLISSSQLLMEKQKEVLHETMEVWKGDLEQVDDILIIGIRV